MFYLRFEPSRRAPWPRSQRRRCTDRTATAAVGASDGGSGRETALQAKRRNPLVSAVRRRCTRVWRGGGGHVVVCTVRHLYPNTADPLSACKHCGKRRRQRQRRRRRRRRCGACDQYFRPSPRRRDGRSAQKTDSAKSHRVLRGWGEGREDYTVSGVGERNGRSAIFNLFCSPAPPPCTFAASIYRGARKGQRSIRTAACVCVARSTVVRATGFRPPRPLSRVYK